MATNHTDSLAATLDKKRTVVLLRSVVVISTSYLILFGPHATDAIGIGYIALLILTNLALILAPAAWFHEFGFSAALLLGDTACVLFGLYLTVGCFSQDFLIIYFFTIFLTTATQGLTQIAAGAAMVSGLYGYWLAMTTPHTLGSGEWLRLPFFFIIAVFYAYMTEETKQERWRRQQAERESAHLRFLLDLGTTMSTGLSNRGFIEHIGRLVNSAFPRLRCVPQSGTVENAGGDRWFPMVAHGVSYGGLRVATADGRPLESHEEQFCRMVALVAANAMYTVSQEQAAGDTQRVKQEFLGMLSHELRTPLHAILGYSEMLQGLLPVQADSVVNDSLDRLRANAFRLHNLVDDMLGLAQLLAGEQNVRVEPVDVRRLFTELADDMRVKLTGRPIAFTWSVASSAATLKTDRRKLQRTILSLLSNAVKFTERGAIHLGATRVGEREIEITVRDTGIGIDRTHIAVIFEEFRQIDSSLTRRSDGLGLGLAVVRELVAMIGGRIDVSSEPGQGATFRVRLPDDPVAIAASGVALETVREPELKPDPVIA